MKEHKLIICDIDGTIANIEHRLHYIKGQKKDWELHMRKEGDYRPDTTIKYEMMYELKITPDDVLCILDDRQSVVDMWRQEGFRCLQVDAWKEEPKRHHLMDADLDDLNMEELKFLVERLKENNNG